MNPTTYSLRNIGLVPVGRIHEPALEMLKLRLPEKFSGASCPIVDFSVDPREFLNSGSGQYHSTRILAALERQGQNTDQDRLLGVTDLDLYVPNMNFIFGEARMPGKVAIISTHRLKGVTDYGGEELFLGRTMKEAMHELGHTLGLKHCERSDCVMHFSNSLKDTDRKSEDYCGSCSKKLGRRR